MRLTWRHYAFLGPESVRAAEATECAAEQERFWAYHDVLFARQAGENRGAFSDSNLKRFAADIGLERGAFDVCLDSQRHADLVQADTSAGARQGVRATPTLFVGGEKIEGSPTYERFRTSILRELSASSPAPTRPGQ